MNLKDILAKFGFYKIKSKVKKIIDKEDFRKIIDKDRIKK